MRPSLFVGEKNKHNTSSSSQPAVVVAGSLRLRPSERSNHPPHHGRPARPRTAHQTNLLRAPHRHRLPPTPPLIPIAPHSSRAPSARLLRVRTKTQATAEPGRAGARGDGGDEAAQVAAGAAADGQLRHGHHHAALPLRPHLHQGPLLHHPIPEQACAVAGGGDRRRLRRQPVQDLGPDRGGGVRPEPPDLLQHEQAVRAVRGGGGHPGGRQPLQDLHQPAGQGVADQAVRAAARPGGHGRRPGVRAAPLRRLQRHDGPTALHPEPLRPGLPLLQRRVRGEPLPRLHRRPRPALHQHAPLRGRGAVPAGRHQGLVAGQVHPILPAPVQLRRDRRGQRPGGALLPADRHRVHLPPRHGHRRHPLPGRRDRGGLQAAPPPRLPPEARRGVPRKTQAPHHLPEVLPPVPERARHGARGGAGAVRRAHRGARQPHGHAQLRAAGELGGRDDGGARRRADQHGVPPQPRRAGAGGAVRRAGVAVPGDLQGPGQGHGRHLHGVQRVPGGELAQGPLPQGSLLPAAPLRRAQEGLGRHQDRLPRQAERHAQPHQVRPHARARKEPPALTLTPFVRSFVRSFVRARLIRPSSSSSSRMLGSLLSSS